MGLFVSVDGSVLYIFDCSSGGVYAAGVGSVVSKGKLIEGAAVYLIDFRYVVEMVTVRGRILS